MEKTECLVVFRRGLLDSEHKCVDLIWFEQGFRIWIKDGEIDCIQYTIGFLHFEWSSDWELEDIWVGKSWGCCRYEVILG